MKKNAHLAAYILLSATLLGCNQPDNSSNIAPAGTTMQDLTVQSAAIAAEREKEKQDALNTEAESKGAKPEAEIGKDNSNKAKTEAEQGKWDYSTETDAMNSKVTRQASLTSENALHFPFPYQGNTYGFLTIRHRASDGLTAIFQVSDGQIICMMGCSVKVRFDDKPAMRFSAEPPSDHSSKVIFLEPASKFVSELKKSKKVLVEVTYYSAGTNISEFATSGFKWEGKTGK